MSKIEEQVIKRIRKRAEIGLKKYGTSMERNDLNDIEWLSHLQEELLDASIYIEKIKTILEDYYKEKYDLF
jgi:hypothetical protein